MAGFFTRLKEGLARSTQKLTGGITAAFTKRKLDDAALEELEDPPHRRRPRPRRSG